MAITRLHLHEKMMEVSGQDISAKKIRVLNFLREHFQTNGDEDATSALNNFMRQSFFPTYITKWKAAGRKNNNFLSRFEDWLRVEIVFPNEVRCQQDLAIPGTSASTSAGRPLEIFEESSNVTKRRRAEETMTTPTRATNSWQTPSNVPVTSYSSEEALSLIVSQNMTVELYKDLRRGAKEHGFDLYPPYHKILKLKKNLYPSNILVSEAKCEVPLQNLLHKTCESLIKCVTISEKSTFCLICKWGFGGSSRYGQSTSAEESLFTTSLVPLRLVDESSSAILWKNPRPSSKSYCRPIRLQWVHETEAIPKLEQADIEQQIGLLQPYLSNFGPVKFELKLTMVDGQVCSALTETSSTSCYICGANISKMNDLSLRPIRQEGLHFGLSMRHAYLRFFECLLQVAYRLEIKTWKVTKEKVAAYDERKKKIQQDFRSRMGLLVDIPKEGAGSTNNGDTARRFFSNPTLSSQITGVDVTLITRFGVILRVLNTGYSINVDKFEEYCKATAELYVSLYNWYYMPPSVHTILIHGAVVIKEGLLSIGELSEKAQETKNDIRKYRSKISPIKINGALFNRLLLSSDPLLSSFQSSKKVDQKVDQTMLPLLDLTDKEKLELKEDEDDDAMGEECEDSDYLY